MGRKIAYQPFATDLWEHPTESQPRMVIALVYFLQILINQNHPSRLGTRCCWLRAAPMAFSPWIQNLQWGCICCGCTFPMNLILDQREVHSRHMAFTLFNSPRVILSLGPLVKHQSANAYEADPGRPCHVLKADKQDALSWPWQTRASPTPILLLSLSQQGRQTPS